MNLSPKHKVLADAVRDALDSACLGITLEAGDEMVVTVPPSRIAETMIKLREGADTAMTMLMDVCGVDYPERPERFDVVYQLLGLKYNERLRVRVAVAEGQALASVAAIYPSAGWFEREVFDMFGIVFEGHPDLRRILTDYGFEGHPLRRDFPLVGFTQVRYDDLHRKVVKEPVSLEQEYRAFDAVSSWKGMTDVQKRGGEHD